MISNNTQFNILCYITHPHCTQVRSAQRPTPTCTTRVATAASTTRKARTLDRVLSVTGVLSASTVCVVRAISTPSVRVHLAPTTDLQVQKP